MTSITESQSYSHIARLTIHPSVWDGTKQKTRRSRLVDSFNFLMGIIEAEPYPVRNKGKSDSKLFKLQEQESWQANLYKDEYVIDQDNENKLINHK